jgi:hypothetical protein
MTVSAIFRLSGSAAILFRPGLCYHLGPKDRDRKITFNNGTATLGDVDEWLKEQNKGQSRWSKAGVIIGGLALRVAIASLIIAICK